jgi:Zn-dependent M28 family amino/carboxypeptidase
VQRLAGDLGERNTIRYATLEQARLYIEQGFTQAGYEIQHDAYQVAGRTYRNVVAERPGSEASVVVIGAHYASGIAVLLELARLLRGFAPAPAIR